MPRASDTTNPRRAVLEGDADGSVLKGTYTWDAENRLAAMETRAGLPAALPRKRIEFVYDYLGRRSVKRVYKPLIADPGDPPLVQDAVAVLLW